MYFRNFTTLFVKYSYLYFSSHGVYGSKVKKRNKHQYVNECHFISYHWSNSENLMYHRRSIKRRSEVGKTSKFNQRSSQVKIKVRRPTKNRSSSQVLTFSAATNHKSSKVEVKKLCCENVLIYMDTHK